MSKKARTKDGQGPSDAAQQKLRAISSIKIIRLESHGGVVLESGTGETPPGEDAKERTERYWTLMSTMERGDLAHPVSAL